MSLSQEKIKVELLLLWAKVYKSKNINGYRILSIDKIKAS